MDKIIRARALRQQPTSAETVLWAQLRDRRLGGHKFRRQRPIGPYFVDFVCVEKRLVVEVDGEPHDLDFKRDASRDAQLEAAGYRVIRIPNEEVRRNLDGVLQTILKSLGGVDRPSP
jgi:adenine-specific DNA-methyltransferase